MTEVRDQVLPNGWTIARIGEFVGPEGLFRDGDWLETKNQNPNGDIRLIQLADIGDGVYLNRSSRFLTNENAIKLRCTFLRPGDVLIARMPDPLGRACIFPGDPMRSVTAVDVCIVRVGLIGVNNRWLVWAINSPDFRGTVATLQSGTTRKRISRGNLAMIGMPVPPLPEQERIVEEVEKQFTRLEAAVAALKRVRANLKRYRGSVLKAACEGRLVPTEAELARSEGRDYESADQLLARILNERRARWEADHLANMKAAGKVPKDDNWKRKYSPPSTPDAPTNLDLPSGWVWTGFEQIAEGHQHAIKAGPFGSALKKSYYVPMGFKIYGQEQVIRGAPHFGDYFISPELYEKLKSCATKPGDILISLVGTAGKVLVLPEGCAPGIINPRLVKLSLNRTGIEPRFVKILLESPQSRAYFKLAAHGGTMEILNLGILKNLPVPLPPLAEQRRIVSEVERCFSVIDELESIASKDLKRAERLRHSILKCAFEGKLVPQDPSDEPAGALLERIRAERAKMASDGKLRKSNGRRRVRRASVMEILV